MSKILFQNSINGSPSYNAEDFTKLFSKIISNGVVFGKDKGNLGVQIFDLKNRTNPQAKISEGTAVIEGAIFLSDSDYYLALPSSDVANYTVYGILLTLDKTDLSFYFRYSPLYNNAVKPTMEETLAMLPYEEENLENLLLATITLPPLSSSNEYPECIERHADSSVCGYVCWLLDNVDTDDYFETYKSSLNTYTNRISDLVSEITGDEQKLRISSFNGLPSSKEITLTEPGIVFNQSTICEVYLNGFKYDYRSEESNINLSVIDGAIVLDGTRVPEKNKIDVVVYALATVEV